MLWIHAKRRMAGVKENTDAEKTKPSLKKKRSHSFTCLNDEIIMMRQLEIHNEWFYHKSIPPLERETACFME